MNREIWAREPLEFRGSIPVFSEANEYTDNYEQISGDHLASVERNGTNPFIPEDLWVQLERSTSDFIKKYAKPGDMILDVGVGLGRLLSHFPDLQRYGMDISFGYLEVARAKGIEVSYALIEDMPYQEELFDLVVCTDVLEHVLDLNLCCAKILSVLKKGGLLIIRVPYREDLSMYLPSVCRYKYVHLRNFDENSLRLHFERVMGCEYVEMSTAGYKESGVRLKCQFPFPKRDGILSRLLFIIKVVHAPAYETLLRKMYYPTVINMAFRKI